MKDLRERREAGFVVHMFDMFSAYLEFGFSYVRFRIQCNRFFEKGLKSMKDIMPARAEVTDAAILVRNFCLHTY